MKKKTIIIIGIALLALISGTCFYVVKYQKSNQLTQSQISAQVPVQSEQPKSTSGKNNKEDNANEFFFKDISSKKQYTYEGIMWGDVILQNTVSQQVAAEGVKIDADLTVTEIAKLIKGKVYEFNFSILGDKVKPEYKEQKLYLWVTTDEVYELSPPENFNTKNFVINGEFDDVNYAKMLEKNNQLPNDDKSLIRCNPSGLSFKDPENPLWETEISVKDNSCSYIRSHNNGHFEKFVWEVDKGLTNYSWGYGARGAGINLAFVNTNTLPANETPNSETTKTNETVAPSSSEIFSKLEGEYLNKDYVDLLKKNKSSKKAITALWAKSKISVVSDYLAASEASGINDYLATYFSKAQSGLDWSWTIDFRHGNGRNINITNTSEKGIYLMRFNSPLNNKNEIKFKIVEENNQVIEIYIDDVGFVKTVNGNRSYINKTLLVGKYKDENGKEYVFSEDGFSIWPTEKFKYDVCLDPMLGEIDYIGRADSSVYYGYEIKDNYLLLYNMTERRGKEVILEEKPFLKLTKIE